MKKTKLGEGGFGEAWLVEKGNGMRFSVKFTNDGFEATSFAWMAANPVRHIARSHGVIRVHGGNYRYAIVKEYVPRLLSDHPSFHAAKHSDFTRGMEHGLRIDYINRMRAGGLMNGHEIADLVKIHEALCHLEGIGIEISDGHDENVGFDEDGNAVFFDICEVRRMGVLMSQEIEVCCDHLPECEEALQLLGLVEACMAA